MKVKSFLRSTTNVFLAAATSLSLQYPAKANYKPYQTVYLSDFGKALRDSGFEYGGYSKFPYCFNTLETLNGYTPIVIVCPLATGKRDSNYSYGRNASVSAIWMSMLIDENASREMTRRALRKAGLVAKVFAYVRYNVTTSSAEDVLVDEVKRVIGREGASYVNSSGSSCNKRTRTLTNIGTFETTACFGRQGTAQVTVWF